MAIFYPPSPTGVGQLVWDSLKKRKREYDMASRYYRKRRRLVTGPRRRVRKYRRTARNRPRTGMALKSNYGLGTYGNYYANRRKPSMRAYRSKLWRDTMGQRHYRAVDTTTAIVNTPTSFSQKVWESVSFIPNNFYLRPILKETQDVTFDRNLVVRGGLVQLTFKNNSTDTVKIEVYSIWMKDHEDAQYIPESNGITNIGDDPTTWNNRAAVGQSNGREYEIKRRRTTLLEAGAVWTVMDKLKIARVHLEDYNTDENNHDRKMYYWFSVQTPGENTTSRVDWARSINMSFSGDVYEKTTPL